MKTITICGKDYPIECNAFTPIKYNSIFKSGLIKDIETIQNYMIKQVITTKQVEGLDLSESEKISKVSNIMIYDVDEFIIKILQITWILIYSANNNIEDFEQWAKSIKCKVDDDWIAEVAEFAVDCFC
jgi:hypothetical protein